MKVSPLTLFVCVCVCANRAELICIQGDSPRYSVGGEISPVKKTGGELLFL